MAAKSIGYSASASGTYLAREGFAKLGEPRYGQVMAKAREVVKDRVGTWVARADLEIGFQQVSELLPIAGAEFVGPIPPPYQKVTVFSAGVTTKASEPQAAQLIAVRAQNPTAVQPGVFASPFGTTRVSGKDWMGTGVPGAVPAGGGTGISTACAADHPGSRRAARREISGFRRMTGSGPSDSAPPSV